MGIDRIGKPGPPASPPPQGPSNEVRGPLRPSEPERAFEVSRSASAAGRAASPVAAAQASPAALDRLRAGEIDANGYVDQKVMEATVHLGNLGPVELEAIRGALRDRVRTDPTLVDLVQAATGQAPQPPRDD
jgi:hypothetical protein